MHEKLAKIEELRIDAGITREQLTRTAEVHVSHYRRLMNGERQPSEITLSRLSQAVNRLRRAEDTSNEPVQKIYRLCVVIVCTDVGADPAEVLSHDPGRRATGDPAWKRAADIRRRAIYIAHVLCGFPQRQLAAAAGMTTAAVSLAMGAVEDRRDDVRDDPLFSQIETALGGV